MKLTVLKAEITITLRRNSTLLGGFNLGIESPVVVLPMESLSFQCITWPANKVKQAPPFYRLCRIPVAGFIQPHYSYQIVHEIFSSGNFPFCRNFIYQEI